MIHLPQIGINSKYTEVLNKFLYDHLPENHSWNQLLCKLWVFLQAQSFLWLTSNKREYYIGTHRIWGEKESYFRKNGNHILPGFLFRDKFSTASFLCCHENDEIGNIFLFLVISLLYLRFELYREKSTLIIRLTRWHAKKASNGT